MVVKTRVASNTEGKHIIHRKQKEKINKSPQCGGYCKGRSLYLCYLSFIFGVEAPYFAKIGEVAASVLVRIPRQS